MFEMIMHNKIAVGGLALVVAFGAWFFLGGDTAPEEGLVTETFTSAVSEADRDLVATLLQLRTVSLDGTIFTDPVFQSLKDFGSEIVAEPVGRPNPFAPLSQTAAAGVPTSTPLR